MDIDALHMRFCQGDALAALKTTVGSENVLGECGQRPGLGAGGNSYGQQCSACCASTCMHSPTKTASHVEL